jgi:hypothetical protein
MRSPNSCKCQQQIFSNTTRDCVTIDKDSPYWKNRTASAHFSQETTADFRPSSRSNAAISLTIGDFPDGAKSAKRFPSTRQSESDQRKSQKTSRSAKERYLQQPKSASTTRQCLSHDSLLQCSGGGIGIRARLRILWLHGLGGSSPPSSTIIINGLCRFLSKVARF